MKEAYLAIFRDNSEFPRYIADSPLMPEISSLMEAFEESLASFSFSSISEFESFMDSLIMQMHNGYSKLLNVKKQEISYSKDYIKGLCQEMVRGCLQMMTREELLEFFKLNEF